MKSGCFHERKVRADSFGDKGLNIFIYVGMISEFIRAFFPQYYFIAAEIRNSNLYIREECLIEFQ